MWSFNVPLVYHPIYNRDLVILVVCVLTTYQQGPLAPMLRSARNLDPAQVLGHQCAGRGCESALRSCCAFDQSRNGFPDEINEITYLQWFIWVY